MADLVTTPVDPQEAVLAEIVLERLEQDAQWGGPGHDDQHDVNCWIAILARHVGLAANDEAATDLARFRRQMVRVAAVAVAAVESLDRKAARVAGAHTPGSGF
jgi:hypothetical protein